MPGHLPNLSTEALAKLRTLVATMNAPIKQAVPMADIVDLASEVEEHTGMTVDFDATRDLGQPMIVLRPSQAERLPQIFNCLSTREREVLTHLIEGKSNKQIASSLCIALPTVKDHVHNILVKTGCASRTEIIATCSRSSGSTPAPSVRPAADPT